MGNQFSTPVIISRDGEKPLERLSLDGSGALTYNENWLQDVLYRHPQALPVNAIDQSYVRLVPVCRELKTPAGFIDVLYATPEGKLVVLEAKLWRNPEARRKVIGQILDYAKELGRWSYEDLQREVAQATRNQFGDPSKLFDLVANKYPEISESQFIDSVSRNLKRGEFLLLIVGDGIHEGVAAIADFLENHGTLHFTFGMVEMAIYKMDDDSLLIQPRVIAQSVIVKRTVITLESEGLVAREANDVEEEDSYEMSDIQKFYVDFWTEFISELKLDDAGQPFPNVTKKGNIFLNLPPKNLTWITIYFSQKDKEVGLFLTFSRGTIADIIYQKLLDDRETIVSELGASLEWKSSEGKHVIFAKTNFPDLRSPEFRSPIKKWLADHANRFVNVFRPRIERILEETRLDNI